jgi:hypothetical protein
MTNWQHTIKIKHLLGIEKSDAAATRVAHEIKTALDKEPSMAHFNTLLFTGRHTVGSLNEAMNTLYDFCDARAIWVE